MHSRNGHIMRTDPEFDEGYDEFLDAERNGYSEGGGWVLFGSDGKTARRLTWVPLGALSVELWITHSW
jgi:hypothetical protein